MRKSLPHTLKPGTRVMYVLGINAYRGICGTVVKLLPGDRCRVRLDDGYKLVEPVTEFCPLRF